MGGDRANTKIGMSNNQNQENLDIVNVNKQKEDEHPEDVDLDKQIKDFNNFIFTEEFLDDDFGVEFEESTVAHWLQSRSKEITKVAVHKYQYYGTILKETRTDDQEIQPEEQYNQEATTIALLHESCP